MSNKLYDDKLDVLFCGFVAILKDYDAKISFVFILHYHRGDFTRQHVCTCIFYTKGQ